VTLRGLPPVEERLGRPVAQGRHDEVHLGERIVGTEQQIPYIRYVTDDFDVRKRRADLTRERDRLRIADGFHTQRMPADV